MDEQTYIGHVADLASNQFHTDLVPTAEFDWLLFAAKSATRWVDSVKKALFYGKPIQLKTDGGTPTSLKYDPELTDLVHGILGLYSEAGELMEHLHDVLTGAKPLDRVNLIEELGDAHWYLALLHKVTGTTPSQTWDINIAKLRARYPDKFTEHDAEHRDLGAERDVLEKSIDG